VFLSGLAVWDRRRIKKTRMTRKIWGKYKKNVTGEYINKTKMATGDVNQIAKLATS
jgi:hypothetical protein